MSFYFSGAQPIDAAKIEAQADTLLSQQDFFNAEKKYTQLLALKSASGNPALFYKRAYAYYGLQKFDKALTDINKYLSINKNDAQAKILRAYIYQERGEFELQLADINDLIAINNNPELLRWRASVALEAGKYTIAQKDIEALLKIESSAELESYLGLAYYYQEKQDSALLVFNEVIKNNPEFIQAYLYAGSLCLEAGESDLGLEYINKGLRVAPSNEMLLFYKGTALVEKTESLDQGCRCLLKAFNAGVDDAADYLKEYCYGVD